MKQADLEIQIGLFYYGVMCNFSQTVCAGCTGTLGKSQTVCAGCTGALGKSAHYTDMPIIWY